MGKVALRWVLGTIGFPPDIGILSISGWVWIYAIATLKQTPRLDPQQPIYFPGELEVLTEQTRTQQGIPVPYALIQDLARHFGPDLVNQHLTPDLSIFPNA